MFTLGGCGGLEGTDFQEFPVWEDVVVLKAMIFNKFYLKKVCKRV